MILSARLTAKGRELFCFKYNVLFFSMEMNPTNSGTKLGIYYLDYSAIFCFSSGFLTKIETLFLSHMWVSTEIKGRKDKYF